MAREPLRIPGATYRFQLQKSFPLPQATARLDYLSALGITDAYLSPILQATPDSTHGYDCVDPTKLSSDICAPNEFQSFASKLKDSELGVLLDIVPNHCALHHTNPWLMDVFESGRSSKYSHFFDIDWDARRFSLTNRILLPVLGDHLHAVVSGAQISLQWCAAPPAFVLHYGSRLIAADPVSVSRLLLCLRAEHCLPAPEPLLEALRQLASLPMHGSSAPAPRLERQQLLPARKAALAQLLAGDSEAAAALGRLLDLLDVTKHGGAGARPLMRLLDEQPYRLCYWRAAADEINYRRFFDIHELLALRMELDDVFDATHALVLGLVERGVVTGLRIDHPDGLADPARYFALLQERAGPLLGPAAAGRSAPLYVVAEKIIEPGEALPEAWPLHGTTGYEAMHALNSVFVDEGAANAFVDCWRAFTGLDLGLGDLVRTCKRSLLESTFASELRRAADVFLALLSADAWTPDWTENQARRHLAALIACLPVYRTYISPRDGSFTASDRRYISEAAQEALGHDRSLDAPLMAALVALLLRGAGAPDARHSRLVTLFQQLSGPAMAKALEDTAFYRFLPLSALNEVGGNPGSFGMPLEEFHRFQQHRAIAWPHALSASSTHDTKRGEDTRARLSFLSEVPDRWFQLLQTWHDGNAALKTHVAGIGPVPPPNEEQFLYQTLLGSWPLGEHEASEAFVSRIQAYMLKASKEAKLHTSWTEPHDAYEAAFSQFIGRVVRHAPFLTSFRPLLDQAAYCGKMTSLSQLVLKVTLPGVPDIYQGTELWDFSLVDPDNRRPVDFDLREKLLSSPLPLAQIAAAVRGDNVGHAKLSLLQALLLFRRQHADLFSFGSYEPVVVRGAQNRRVVAFLRSHNGQQVLVAAARFFASTPVEGDAVASFWADTELRGLPEGSWQDILSSRQHKSEGGDLHLGAVFASAPWAVLLRQPTTDRA